MRFEDPSKSCACLSDERTRAGGACEGFSRTVCGVHAQACPAAGRKLLRHRSSVVEHTLGKGEVEGSIPFGGFGGVVDGVAQSLSWLFP